MQVNPTSSLMPLIRATPPWLRSRLPWLILAVAIMHVLISGAPLGLGLALGLLLSEMLIIMRFPVLLTCARSALVALISAVASAAVAVDSGIIAPVIALIGLTALAALGRREQSAPGPLLSAALVALVLSPLRAMADVKAAWAWRRRRPAAASRSLSVWLVPFAIGLGFISCFAVANPLIAEGLFQVTKLHVWLPDLTTLATWMMAVLLMATWLRGRWLATTWPVMATHAVSHDNCAHVVRCLVIANLVFAGQHVVDAVYLFGHQDLPVGMTYAGYAHRGAYSLVATALLAAGFMLWWFRAGAASAHDPRCRVLVMVWVGQNALLVGTAQWRLALYVDAYGLTRWRVGAAVWMGLVAVGLLLIGMRIWTNRSNTWLVDSNIVTTVLALLIVAWSDVDGAIAWQQLSHAEREQINPDLEYICGLGPAALPALRYFRQQHPWVNRGPWIRELEQELNSASPDWRGWTWRRDQWRRQ